MRTLRTVYVLLLVAVLSVVARVGLGQPSGCPTPTTYNGISTFPVAILSENRNNVFEGFCTTWNAVGVGSPNTTNNKFPQAYSLPFAQDTYVNPSRTVDAKNSIIYTLTSNFVQANMRTMVMALQLTTSSYPSQAVLDGGIYSIQNYNIEVPTIGLIQYHPTQEVIYFVGSKFLPVGTNQRFVIGYLNTSTTSSKIVYRTEPVEGQLSFSAGVLNSVKEFYAFCVVTTSPNSPKRGTSYVYSLLTGEVTTAHYTGDSNFWHCIEWAFDLFSGNIYGAYSSPKGGIDFGIVDPSTATISNVVTLYDGPASVVSATLTVDYIVGNGYLVYRLPNGIDQAYNFELIQFDPSSGTIYSKSSTNESFPTWVIYAEWLNTNTY